MNAAELIQHCRARREGTPEGSITDPSVLGDVLTMLLDDRLAELATRARPPSRHVYDSNQGTVVPTEPAVPAPDPREDGIACKLATLVGYLEDRR